MIHSVMGDAYRETAQARQGARELEALARYRQKAGDKRGQGVTLPNLASLYEQTGDIPKALDPPRRSARRSPARCATGRASRSAPQHGHDLQGGRRPRRARSRPSATRCRSRWSAARLREIANRLDKVADVYRLNGQLRRRARLPRAGEGPSREDRRQAGGRDQPAVLRRGLRGAGALQGRAHRVPGGAARFPGDQPADRCRHGTQRPRRSLRAPGPLRRRLELAFRRRSRPTPSSRPSTTSPR